MKTTVIDRISYHAVYDDSILAALQYAHQNGFKGIQLADESPHLSFERLSASELGKIIAFIADTGIKISLHAPDEAVSLFITSPSLRKGIEEYFKKLVEFALLTNAHILTIHLGSPTYFRTDTDPEERYPSQAIPLYRESIYSGLDYLIALTEDKIELCVENYRLELEFLNILGPYIEDGRLSLCWDIAKSHDNQKLVEYFWENIKSVRQVHLHDCGDRHGRKRCHRTIGSGDIDFSQYLPKFQDSNVLDFCIEVRPCEKALESLEALHRMIEDSSKKS